MSQKEYQREYYLRNREKKLAYQAARHASGERKRNKEQEYAYTREWKKRNKEHVAESYRNWKANNADSVAARMKLWNVANKDKVQKYNREVRYPRDREDFIVRSYRRPRYNEWAEAAMALRLARKLLKLLEMEHEEVNP